jgi:ABC-type spermidine/putrescine transport system permease subunit II
VSAITTANRRRIGSGSSLLTAVSIAVFVFLYIPLAVIVLYSFSGQRIASWPISDYTLSRYSEMWNDREIRDGIMLSFRIGLIAALLAILLGTLAAIAVDRFSFPGKSLLRFCIVLPITLPGIVTGVAMLSFFSVADVPLSNRTIIIGHTTFCITLILNNVVARLSQIPRSLDDASADLGATPWRTFWRVTFPLILPAILSGGILAFTLSFDEIVVTLFLKGRDATLPLVIWGRLRQGFSPEVNAAAVAVIGVSFVGVLLANRISRWTGSA